MDAELLLAGVLGGILLGGFYAAIAQGLQVSFGLLDVPHVAHPAMLVVGAYSALAVSRWGMDPLLAGLLLMPVFFVAGVLLYRFYHFVFERRASDVEVRGLAFFFGVAYILELLLILVFGVEQQMGRAPYIGSSFTIFDIRLPTRMLVAGAVALVLSAVLIAYLRFSFLGRAIRAVAQQPEGILIVGADPVRIRQWAFGIAVATASMCGSLLLLIGPIEPNLGWSYLGRVFAVVVLAGMGSLTGTVIAAVILGVCESVVLSSVGSSWTPAVAFGILLLLLAVRPSGLFGQR